LICRNAKYLHSYARHVHVILMYVKGYNLPNCENTPADTRMAATAKWDPGRGDVNQLALSRTCQSPTTGLGTRMHMTSSAAHSERANNAQTTRSGKRTALQFAKNRLRGPALFHPGRAFPCVHAKHTLDKLGRQAVESSTVSQHCTSHLIELTAMTVWVEGAGVVEELR
jgi:hypothetical protein